jgi:hypothetical protein
MRLDRELNLQQVGGSVIGQSVFARLTHGRGWWAALALLALGLFVIGAFAFHAMRTHAETPATPSHAVGPR